MSDCSAMFMICAKGGRKKSKSKSYREKTREKRKERDMLMHLLRLRGWRSEAELRELTDWLGVLVSADRSIPRSRIENCRGLNDFVRGPSHWKQRYLQALRDHIDAVHLFKISMYDMSVPLCSMVNF